MSRILPFRPAAAHRLAPRPVLLSRALRRPRAAWALALAAALCAPGLVQAQAAAPAPPAAPAASAADPKAVRAEFGLPLQAAQTLLGQGKAPEALAKLVEAEAVPNRTPWESWLLYRTRASAAQSAGDSALVVTALEAALATGQAEPAEEVPLVEAMVSLSARARDHARVLRWADRYEALKGPNDVVRVMRIQSQADSGDEAGARAALLARVEAAEREGRAAPESHLRMLLGLQFKGRDTDAARRSLERLVAAYPRPEYWADLISQASREPSLSDRALLELYRLLRATGNLKAADLRFEMAQLAQRAGQPGEALVVLEEGYAAGTLGTGAQAGEHGKLRDQLRRQAAADKADRTAAESAARRAADGTGLVDLGWSVLTSAGGEGAGAAAESGLALMEQGVAKGGLKRASEQRLHLGIAQLAAGRKDAAKQTLGALAGQIGSDPLATPVRLWNLYAQAPAMLPPRP